MTIEIDTGIVGDRSDNTTYQHVPTTNPAGWHTVDAGAGLWQKWNNAAGDVTGNPLISLSDVATAHTSVLDVVRAYLRAWHGRFCPMELEMALLHGWTLPPWVASPMILK